MLSNVRLSYKTVVFSIQNIGSWQECWWLQRSYPNMQTGQDSHVSILLLAIMFFALHFMSEILHQIYIFDEICCTNSFSHNDQKMYVTFACHTRQLFSAYKILEVGRNAGDSRGLIQICKLVTNFNNLSSKIPRISVTFYERNITSNIYLRWNMLH
jgi:hypothetical protein